MRVLSLLVLAVLSLPLAAEAQVLPHQYRLTRTLPGPAQSFVFPKAGLPCNLPKATQASGVGVRFEDPADPARDCEYLGTANGVIPTRVPGVVYAFSLAASNEQGEWTIEVPAANVNMPLPPGSPRVRPGAPAVALHGVIDPLFPFNRIPGMPLEVAPSIASVEGLPVTAPFYFGTPTFLGRVKPGMQWALAIWEGDR